CIACGDLDGKPSDAARLSAGHWTQPALAQSHLRLRPPASGPHHGPDHRRARRPARDRRGDVSAAGAVQPGEIFLTPASPAFRMLRQLVLQHAPSKGVSYIAPLVGTSMATLHLMVGLPGSGKTTLARKLEAELSALRLTVDEWHVRLFGCD